MATLRAITTALLKHKKIKTTLAKAKATRSFAEPLITKAKNDSVANRRLVAKHINDKAVVKELFGEIIEKIGDRAGGYTRVVKLGNRLGDAAEMAIIELVDYNDLGAGKEKKSKTAAEDKVEEVKAEVVDAGKVKSKADVQDAEIVEEVKAEASEETKEKKKPAKAKAKTKIGKAEEVKEEKEEKAKPKAKATKEKTKDPKAKTEKKEEAPKKAKAKPKKDKG